MLPGKIKIGLFICFIHLSSHAFSSGYLQNQSDTLLGMDLLSEAQRLEDRGFPYMALSIYQKVIQIRKNRFPEWDKDWFLPSIYNGMGISYKNLGQFDKALEYYRKSEELYNKIYPPNYPQNGDLLSNIGNILSLQGNYSDGIRYFSHAIELYEKDRKNQLINLNNTYYNLANTYYMMNNYDESIRIIKSHFKSAPDDLKFQYYNLMANINVAQGDRESARKNLIAAINHMWFKLPGWYKDVVIQYLAYAEFLMKEDNYWEALGYIKLAENIIKNRLGENVKAERTFYEIYGDYFITKKVLSKDLETFKNLKIKNLEEGTLHYFKALGVLGLPQNANELESVDFKNLAYISSILKLLSKIGTAYSDIAEMHNQPGDSANIEFLKKSLICFKKASELVQFARTGAIKEESKALISQIQQPIFYNLNRIAWNLYHLTNDNEFFNIAFQNTERNKAASINDILKERSARQLTLIPDSLNNKDIDITRKLTFYYEKVFNDKNEGKPDSTIEKTEKLIYGLERERDSLREVLEKRYPEYFNLKYFNKSVDLETISKKLGINESIIEYALEKASSADDPSWLYIFCISRRGHTFERIEIDSTFFLNIKAVLKFVHNPYFFLTDRNEVAQFEKASYSLYEKLILPVDSMLKQGKVTIIPDRELNYLPFDALLTSLPADPTFSLKSLPYMIFKNTINYSYSANLFFAVQSGRKAKKKLIAFAPDYALHSGSGISRTNSLKPIPGINEEVNLIESRIKSVILRNGSATELNFREKAGYFDIIHLAMHTNLNDSVPMFSKLAFTLNPEGPIENDGWITTSDIYNMNLHARLVVLSACSTGGGQLRDGEGIISLARGFRYAGCSAIVMTQWEIQDRSGTEIMNWFYRNLKNGKSKDSALRLAKLKLIQESDPLTAHPHYWMGFVTIGKTDPLFLSNDFYFFTGILFLLIIILTDQLIRNIKKHQRKV